MLQRTIVLVLVFLSGGLALQLLLRVGNVACFSLDIQNYAAEVVATAAVALGVGAVTSLVSTG